MKLPIENRRAAGRALARALESHAGRRDLLVLALPRGGVPVAYEIARQLRAELDVLIVRKLGAPGQPELAMGAIASGGARIVNEDIVRALGVTADEMETVAAREREELERREQTYRGARPRTAVEGRRIVLVDDGVATGATMRAGIAALHRLGAKHIIVAVPVAPSDTVRLLREEGAEVVCLATPSPFRAVGQWYASFEQVADKEVRELLEDVWTAGDDELGNGRGEGE